MAHVDTLQPLFTAEKPQELAEAVGDLLHRWITVERQPRLARYELALEGLRRPELAAELHEAAGHIVAGISAILAGMGATDPERQGKWLVACIEGLLFANIAGAHATDPMTVAELRSAAYDLIGAVLPPSSTERLP
jgi:hypothetical protein